MARTNRRAPYGPELDFSCTRGDLYVFCSVGIALMLTSMAAVAVGMSTPIEGAFWAVMAWCAPAAATLACFAHTDEEEWVTLIALSVLGPLLPLVLARHMKAVEEHGSDWEAVWPPLPPSG